MYAVILGCKYTEDNPVKNASFYLYCRLSQFCLFPPGAAL